MIITKFPKFLIGQKVICVDDDFRNLKNYPVGDVLFPVKGKSYTIRQIIWVQAKNTFGVTLNEIYNGLLPNSHLEFNFAEFRFEPLEQIELAQEKLVAEVQKILEENLIMV